MDNPLILAIDPIPPSNTGFCWAASIEMIARHYISVGPDMQCKLSRDVPVLDKNKSGCYPGLMPDNAFLYYELFKRIKISCSQFHTRLLPEMAVITDLLNKKQPLIFSGLHYPLCSSGAQHAYVVRGYYQHSSINWILINDPLYGDEKSKVAWIYNEIIFFHKKLSTRRNNVVDIVTNFNLSNQATDVGFKVRDLSKGYGNFLTQDQLKSKIFTDILNTDLITKFFEIDIQNPVLSKPVYYYSLPFDDLITGAFNDSKFKLNGVLLYSVNVNFTAYLDIIIHERSNNVFHILGIKNSFNQDPIKSVWVSYGDINMKFEFNYLDPNYELINIEPFNILFQMFNIEGFDFYVPLKNYQKVFSRGQVYTQGDMDKLLTVLQIPENY